MHSGLGVTKVMNMISNIFSYNFISESFIQTITDFVNTHNHEQIEYIDSQPVIFNIEPQIIYIYLSP